MVITERQSISVLDELEFSCA